jgi:CubicO group peptidase (beta-lactamase class C family)
MKRNIILSVTTLLLGVIIYFAIAEEKPNSRKDYLIKRENIQNNIVLVRNENDLLPFKNLENKQIACISINETISNPFTDRLNKYSQIEHFSINTKAKLQDWKELSSKLKNYTTLIIALHWNQKQEPDFSRQVIQILNKMAKQSESVFVLFGDDENFMKLGTLINFKSVFLAQNTDLLHQELTAEMIFGGTTVTGKLKNDISTNLPKGFGINLPTQIRFSYTIPEASGLDSEFLNAKIDSIAQTALAQKAFPGFQVLVAKDMNVVFHKTYGFHTFEQKQPVLPTDIYDLASVTKVAAATLALMKLYDNQEIDLNDKFSNTWTDWKKTDKEKLTWRELLTHQAGLKAWIPFWTELFDKKGNPKKEFLQKDSSGLYSIKLNDSLFLINTYKKIVLQKIKEEKLNKERKYLYSCLSFYIYPEIIKQKSGLDFENFLNREFYKPLGINTLNFNAYQHFPLQRIVPTERDTFFRKTQIHGTVHDEGAMVIGGVSGNAGLFGTANDLAILMQMLLNKGTYGGKQFLKPQTIDEFTRVQFPENDNRRALGFDKPIFGNDTLSLDQAYPAPAVSKNSFGHSGFTGTFIWADPDTGIIFIFLSNRVFPTRNNNLIYSLNIRPSIHQAIYESSIKNFKKIHK